MEENAGRLARERVMTDLKALAGDAEALLRTTADDVGGKAQEARARLSAAIDKAKATCEDLKTRGVESAKASVRKADDLVRTHPYESIAVAFGFGLLLGAVLRRK